MDNVNVIRQGFYAPEFSLPDSDGNLMELESLIKGRFIALCFFPEIISEKIKGLLKNLGKGLPKTASGREVDIAGISPMKAAKLAELKAALGLSFTLLSDYRNSVCKRYYVENTRQGNGSVYFSIFIIDDESVVRYRISETPESSEFDLEKFKKEISALV